VLAERPRIFRLGKAEHHVVAVVSAHMHRPRRDRKGVRKAAHGLALFEAWTFSAGSLTWCGHWRRRSARVISPLRVIVERRLWSILLAILADPPNAGSAINDSQ
jgi:hypothetical protein